MHLLLPFLLNTRSFPLAWPAASSILVVTLGQEIWQLELRAFDVRLCMAIVTPRVQVYTEGKRDEYAWQNIPAYCRKAMTVGT